VQYPQSPFQPQPPPPQPPTGATTQVTKMVTLGIVLMMVVLIGGAVLRTFLGGPSKARGPQAGVVTLGHSGWEDGHVAYTKDVPKDAASKVAEYFRGAGWFPNGGSDPALAGHGAPKLSRVQGGGHGTVALVEVERTATAYRVVVYAKTVDAAVKDFAPKARDALQTQLATQVELVVRVEKDLGSSIEWTDWSPP